MQCLWLMRVNIQQWFTRPRVRIPLVVEVASSSLPISLLMIFRSSKNHFIAQRPENGVREIQKCQVWNQFSRTSVFWGREIVFRSPAQQATTYRHESLRFSGDPRWDRCNNFQIAFVTSSIDGWLLVRLIFLADKATSDTDETWSWVTSRELWVLLSWVRTSSLLRVEIAV